MDIVIEKDTKLVVFAGLGGDGYPLESKHELIKDVDYDITKGINGIYYDKDTKKFSESNERKFKAVRTKRDQLLKDSDYTQLSDSTHPNTKEEWKTYRQKLRDITKGVTDPDTIVFPEEPK